MEKHALAILERAESWNWPTLSCVEQLGGQENDRFKTMSQKLLSGFVTESYRLGGTLVDKLWGAVEKCDPQVKENGERHIGISLRSRWLTGHMHSTRTPAHRVFFSRSIRIVII